MKKHQSGFTLVEIAIVLVIIGLLLGGVLKGQEMIANAKYKNLRSDINSYSAAVYAFQDRFRALPGDFLNIARLNAAATPGNNGGTIGGNTCATAGEESCVVWQHLRYANLIPGDPTLTAATANPNHSYGGVFRGIYTANFGGRTGVGTQLTAVPQDVAQRLDDDLDDGVANTGTVSCANCGGGAVYTAGSKSVNVMF